MPLTLLLVLVVLAVCAATVHGPASRYARGYVNALLVETAVQEPGAQPPALRAAARRRALLRAGRQTALFLLAALGACTAALWAGRWHEAVLVLPVLAALTVAGSTDAVCHRLPNRLLGPAALWAAVCVVVDVLARLAAGTGPAQALLPLAGALGAAAGLGGATLLLALVPSGIGMGDVKLCAITGLWLGRLGWAVPVAGVVAGLLLAGLAAIVLMVLRRAQRDTMIAMGPYLVAGACAAWVLAVL
ncbi:MULTISPECIES: prepilin peptidase [unclassified Actinomyces]|uniref:prepilin peptidase n=1 Tax=unclassified Actinomyces TaxID=2609248 RepID=UPI00201793A7|nr:MULTISPECIES: prepilin peptidase [unclassified Actinomyces]MCL3777064.1 prepilin peptidase [Actinomyces sp. AC-20-1]MCL3790284.1 prepilin peptidase [Actinomyces sp. 187325]MCL3791285.1 prepilin peptidase [Actinomyces sp. 186855]MCL3793788.1 prepilin peptidase [Actinomyces sp. 217892]